MFSLTNLLILLVLTSFFLLVSRLNSIILSLVALEVLLLFSSCFLLVSLTGTLLVVPFFITLLVFIVVEAVIGLLIFISGISSTGAYYLNFSSLSSL